MVNWKQKLSSRKFWSLIISLIGAILVAFNVQNGTVEQIAAIIGGFASVITYILAEAYVDGKAVENKDLN
ncbi:MAG: hypothetical protein GX957_08565 [Clostridiaceae bacterium]|nr:hypothetical protein [Clostridiaceae bacterium]